MKRRTFLAAPLAAGVIPALGRSPLLGRATEDSTIIRMDSDGVPLSPPEYSSLLQKLSDHIKPDDYSRGGIVAELEQKVAAALGKETAVWVSTGTLANHLAVRLLAGDKRRVLLQAESHLYNDCGDCCQTLSGLNVLPLAPGKATFTLEDVEREAARGASGRVAVPIGAIQIETPVRRRNGEMFDFKEIRRISEWARKRNIGLHLDGARLFLESAYSGRSVREYATLFDTVYVSMYKYFNAASGAILAGPEKLLADLFHPRRMFGGGLPAVWPFAAVANHYFDGFTERYGKAVATSESVIAALQKDSRFEITRVPDGTNNFSIRINGVDPQTYRDRLQRSAVVLPTPNTAGRFAVHVNETWIRATADQIVSRLVQAASAA